MFTLRHIELFQVVPLVDALYKEFFPHIIYCSVQGNENKYEKIVRAGYKTTRYVQIQAVGHQPGTLAFMWDYIMYPVSRLENNLLKNIWLETFIVLYLHSERCKYQVIIPVLVMLKSNVASQRFLIFRIKWRLIMLNTVLSHRSDSI